MCNANTWLADLPAGLARQQRLMEAVVSWCQTDPEVRWLVVGCSMARGNADGLSDLDMAMGVIDGQVDAAVGRIVDAVGGFGELVECVQHRIPTVAIAHRRIFAQFADRTQIDLVVADASNNGNPNTVVLYDPSGVVVTEFAASDVASSEAVWTWSCQAWEELVNVGKYLRRQSPWEAHDRLEAARSHLWQLWAVAEGIAHPQYGITSLLDGIEPAAFPIGIEATASGIDLGDVLEAAIRLASVLTDLQRRLVETGRYRLAEAFGRFVTRDLKTLRSSAE
jgi:hypothetical protein